MQKPIRSKRPSKLKPKPQNSKAIRATSQVRIIGGQYKRRQLGFIDHDGLRPTPDRVRETIFNWLMHDLQGARVLDVCAGSGVLGFEALSRGGAFATFIEASSAQAALLQQSANTLNCTDSTHIYHGYAEHILPTLSGTFDLIFIDPPYNAQLWQAIISTLIAQTLIHTDSIIYLEANRPLDELLSADLLAHFQIGKSQRFGQIYAYLLRPLLQPLG